MLILSCRSLNSSVKIATPLFFIRTKFGMYFSTSSWKVWTDRSPISKMPFFNGHFKFSPFFSEANKLSTYIRTITFWRRLWSAQMLTVYSYGSLLTDGSSKVILKNKFRRSRMTLKIIGPLKPGLVGPVTVKFPNRLSHFTVRFSNLNANPASEALKLK